jgi:hypothetical protein
MILAKLKADDSLRAELLATEMLFSGLKTEGISYLRKLESVEPDVRPGLAAKLSMHMNWLATIVRPSNGAENICGATPRLAMAAAGCSS